jgi:hypothetical protein
MGDLRPAVVATNSALIVLSLSAISCRVGRKVLLKRPFSWHDGELDLFHVRASRLTTVALIVLASLFATIFSILLMVATRFGLGLPNSAVSRRDLRMVLKVCRTSLKPETCRLNNSVARYDLQSLLFPVQLDGQSLTSTFLHDTHSRSRGPLLHKHHVRG